MPFARLSAHAARHDDMNIVLLTEMDAQAILQAAPYAHGATATYQLPKSKMAQSQREAKTFLCRHCHDPHPGHPMRTKQKDGFQAMTFDSLSRHAMKR